MRIVSYNILDGGVGRADPLAEVLIAQRADIVGLVEADDPATLHRIAERLGMDFIHATGARKGAAILSRWPIVETIDQTLTGASDASIKSFLTATIAGDDAHWNVSVVHLTARATEEKEKAREREIAFVLNRLGDLRRGNHPHLIVGDFNSNSPEQIIDPNRCKHATRRAYGSNGGTIPRRVVSTLLAAGYCDSYRQLHAPGPEEIGSFTTQHPGQRVDYIFTFGLERSKISDAWIEQDRLAKYASDHFPIGAQIA